MRISIGFCAVVLAVGACSSYSPSLPEAPFLCGSAAPLCPDGFTCQTEAVTGRMVCVTPNGTIPDSGMSGMCADDSNLEPNNDTSHAYPTTIDDSRTMLKFSGLAICPMGDIDMYSVTLTKGTTGPPATNESIEAIVTYQASGAPLQVSILNGGGSPVVNGAPVMGMSDTIRAYLAMAPNGQYYVSVFGPNMGAVQTNNYELTINVTGPM